MKNKKIILLLVFMCGILFLAGCKPIFVTPTDPYEQIQLSKEQLEQGVFYLKEGTKFVQVWKPDIITVNESVMNSNKMLIFLHEDIRAVPTLYKDEILAIASKNTEIKAPKLIRFKEIGYSVGCYNMEVDEKGYYCGTLSQNVFQKSDFYNSLKNNAPSEQFKIISVNNTPVNEEMFYGSSSNIFSCMEKDKEYNLELYSGTYYTKFSVVADTLVLESFELFDMPLGNNTKNGYISFQMPSNAKSGWYYLDGYGLFKYINDKKGANEESINMNEAVYMSEKERLTEYSQKFSATFDIRKTNISFVFKYVLNNVKLDDIKGVIYSPDNTEYLLNLDEENEQLYCDLYEAMAGKWEIYIQPKDLQIVNMEIVPNKLDTEITEVINTLEIEESEANLLIRIPYSGEGEIYTIMVGPDNRMYEFITNSKDKYMYYLAPYLGKGIYTLKTYHFADTVIHDIELEKDVKSQTEIITITE